MSAKSIFTSFHSTFARNLRWPRAPSILHHLLMMGFSFHLTRINSQLAIHSSRRRLHYSRTKDTEIYILISESALIPSGRRELRETTCKRIFNLKHVYIQQTLKITNQYLVPRIIKAALVFLKMIPRLCVTLFSRARSSLHHANQTRATRPIAR